MRDTLHFFVVLRNAAERCGLWGLYVRIFDSLLGVVLVLSFCMLLTSKKILEIHGMDVSCPCYSDEQCFPRGRILVAEEYFMNTSM